MSRLSPLSGKVAAAISGYPVLSGRGASPCIPPFVSGVAGEPREHLQGGTHARRKNFEKVVGSHRRPFFVLKR